MANPNESLLRSAVEKLAPLLDKVVFVGGCMNGLLITDPGAAGVRVTRDVDVIVELQNDFGYVIADEILREEESLENHLIPVRKAKDVDTIVQISSYPEFIKFSAKLRELGFSESIEENSPICRWVNGDLILDVMPTDPTVFNFTNRWYHAAFENARTTQIGEYEIRVITAPYFLATKLEAFHGRGKNDYQMSHDMEDIVTVIDGRREIIEEVHLSEPGLRKYLSDEFRGLLSDKAFVEALPGFLLPDAVSQQRIGVIVERIKYLIGD